MKRLTVGLLLAGLLCTSASAWEEKDARAERRAAAKAAMRARNYCRALEHWSAVLDLTPKTAEHRAERIECFHAVVDASRRCSRTQLQKQLNAFIAEFPAAASDLRDFENLAGWRFAKIPQRVDPRSRQLIIISTWRRPESEFRVYAIDPTVLEPVWADPDKDAPSTHDFESWLQTPGALTPLGDMKSHHGGSLQVAPHPSHEYVLRHEYKGVRRWLPFSMPSFEVFVRTSGQNLMAWTFDPWTGTPVPDVAIKILSEDLSEVRGRTDSAGVFRTVYRLDSMAYLTARRGNEVRSCDVDWWSEVPPHSESLVHITTDRPIYRPGHTVHFKAVLRERNGAVLKRPAIQAVRVEVRDGYGRTLHRERKSWSDFGSITGSFTLARSSALGSYRIVVDVESQRTRAAFDWIDGVETNWTHGFEVAEYQNPEFTASVRVADAANDPPRPQIRAVIEADYFFGSPVGGAVVRWRATRVKSDPTNSLPESPRPEPDDRRAAFFENAQQDWFDDNEYDVDEDGLWITDETEGEADYAWDHFEASYDRWKAASETIGIGRGRLSQEGELSVVLQAPIEHTPGRILLEALVRDETNIVRATRYVSFEGIGRVVVSTSERFITGGGAFEVQAKVTDAEGASLSQKNVELVGFLQRTATPADAAEWESFVSATEVTDANGVARVRWLAPPTSGRVRILARAVDGAYAVEDRYDIVCAAQHDATMTQQPSPFEDSPLYVVPDRYIGSVGDTVTFLLRSSKAQTRGVLLLSSGHEIESQPITLDKGWTQLELPLQVQHSGSLEVELLVVNNGAVHRFVNSLLVYPAERVFDVDVSLDRRAYAPGEKARVRLATNARAETEIELAIVDASVFALAGDANTDPRTFFLLPPESSGGLSGSTNLASDANGFGIKEDEYGDAISFTDDPLAEEDCSIDIGEDQAAPLQIRRNFPDTMFYAGQITTDEHGHAVVEIDIPDSLTEWRVVARAISGDDKFGVGHSEILTRKNVVVRLLTPPFLTAGDEAQVTAIVHNDLDQRAIFQLELQSYSQDHFTENFRQDVAHMTFGIEIEAGGEASRSWPVGADEPGFLKLLVSAISSQGSDAIERTLEVKRRGAEKRVAITGTVNGAWRSALTLPEDAVAGSARLEVRALPADISVVESALDYLAGYPYGCVEQTMSRFLPSLIALRSMERLGIDNPALAAKLPKMIDEGLQRLYGFQHFDGGWGWWQDDDTNVDMTAYVLFGLATARAAGVRVDGLALSKGFDALSEQDDIPALGILAQRIAGEIDEEGERDLRQLAEPKSIEDRAFLVLAGRKDLADGLPRRAAVPTTADGVREMALTLKALHSVGTNDATRALARALLLARRGEAWHSTLDSAWAVYALVDVLGRQPVPKLEVRAGGYNRPIEQNVATIDFLKAAPGSAIPFTVNAHIHAQSPEYADVYATAVLHYEVKEIPEPDPESTGIGGAFELTRQFQRIAIVDGEETWVTLTSGAVVEVGEPLRCVITLISNRPDERYVMVESPLPAGFAAREALSEFDHEDVSPSLDDFDRIEYREDRVAAAADQTNGLAPHTLVYRLRATRPGTYTARPARAFAMYEPERQGFAPAFRLVVR